MVVMSRLPIIRLNAKGANTFSYGSIWNRTSDLMAVHDREFSRKDGNVFLILQTDSYPYDIIQLPETCHATRIDEVIQFAKVQCEKIGETRLLQLKLPNKARTKCWTEAPSVRFEL